LAANPFQSDCGVATTIRIPSTLTCATLRYTAIRLATEPTSSGGGNYVEDKILRE